MELAAIGVTVLEVREKLGELRIHVPARDVRRPEVQAVVQRAAQRASQTCDLCGAPGTLRFDLARMVRCDAHVKSDPDEF